MARNLDRLLLICGIFGTPIFLLATFLLRFLYPYPYITQTISSLGALDSPVKALANIFIFNLFGILIALFAIGVFRSSEVRMVGKIGAVFFLLTGVSMFLVGIFSGSAAQVDHPTAGDAIHNGFAFYPFLLMPVGFLLFAADILSNKKLWWLVFPIVLVGPVSLITRYYFSQFPHIYYVGVLQLIAIGLPFLILMVIAMAMYRALTNKGAILFAAAIIIVLISGAGLAAGIDTASERTGIPYVCTDEANCQAFCHNRMGRCQKACDVYPENAVCKKLF